MTLLHRFRAWLLDRWAQVDGPWSSDGRLGFRLIVISAMTSVVVGFLGPSSLAINVGPANGSLLPPWFIPEEWGKTIGLPLSAWFLVPLLWTTIALGAVGLWIAWRAVDAGWRPRIHLMFYLGVAMNMATAFVLPLTSADVLMYAAYGRLQRQGMDPYSITPAEVFRQSFDPVLVWTERPWQDTPSVYGPVASASQWVANMLGGESMHDIVFWLQMMAVIPFIIVCAIMIKLAHGDAALQTRSVLFTICNPLLIWAVVAGAHNEALTLVFAIAALWFIRRSPLMAGVFIGLAGSVKASLVFYGLAMLWGYRREPRKMLLLCLGALIPISIGYGIFAPGALFAAGRNTGYIASGGWALPMLWLFDLVLDYNVARSVIAVLGWVGLVVIAYMLSRILPWQAVPGASVPGERDPLTITVRTALLLCTAWIVTTPWSLSWYDLIAWAPLALMAPNRLDWLLTLRGSTLSIAFVMGRTVGFTQDQLVMSWLARDMLSSGTQMAVLVLIVLWFRQAGGRLPWPRRPRTPSPAEAASN